MSRSRTGCEITRSGQLPPSVAPAWMAAFEPGAPHPILARRRWRSQNAPREPPAAGQGLPFHPVLDWTSRPGSAHVTIRGLPVTALTRKLSPSPPLTDATPTSAPAPLVSVRAVTDHAAVRARDGTSDHHALALPAPLPDPAARASPEE